MTCQQFADALLDGRDELAHARDCADCAKLLDTHRAALRLSHEPVPSLAPVEFGALVDRRRNLRAGASIFAVTAAALAVFLVWRAPAAVTPAHPAQAPVVANTSGGHSETDGLKVSAAPQQPEQAWSVEGLIAFLEYDTGRDPEFDDDVYAAFGALPEWMALPRTDQNVLASIPFTEEEYKP